ncbi:hypothetical protein ACFVUN_36020 [Kitasatospora griseola]|uniref:hypothetical protein n=1 Tax=Kitasatospora griseola TaxID=2064 RepID=UPI0036DA6985
MERTLVPAATAAQQLGVELDVDRVRAALAYKRQGPGVFVPCLLWVGSIAYLMYIYHVVGCTPGGRLTPEAGACAPWSSVWANLAGLAAVGLLVTLSKVLLVARTGQAIAVIYRPVYPALDLLRASSELAAGDPVGRYDDAVALSEKAAGLRQPLREAMKSITLAHGSGAVLKAAVEVHAERVQTAVALAADDLLVNRHAAATRLGVLAASITNNLAHERFAELVPEADLPAAAPLEPDRLDGRRLMKACRRGALWVLVLLVALWWSGAGPELVIPSGVVLWLPVSFLVLCNRHGLGEASRLIRGIKALFQGVDAPPPS